MKDFLFKALLFVLGFSVGFGVELLCVVLIYEVTGSLFLPRGPAGIVVPILFGVLFVKYLPEIIRNVPALKNFVIRVFKEGGVVRRCFIAGSAFWVFLVGAFVFLFEPYGYSMSDSEMYHMFKVMLFLPVMVGLAYLVYRKVVSKS